MFDFIATYINDNGEYGQCTIRALSFATAAEGAAPVVDGLNLVCLALKGTDLDGLDIAS